MDYYRARIVSQGEGARNEKAHEYGSWREADMHCRRVKGRKTVLQTAIEVWDEEKQAWVDYYSKKTSTYRSWSLPKDWVSPKSSFKKKPAYVPPKPAYVPPKPNSIEEIADLDLSFELVTGGVLAG